MNEKLLTIALSRLKGVSQTTALQLYRHFGSATEVYTHRTEIKDKCRTALLDWNEAVRRAEAELEFCEKNGIEILPLGASEYPIRLRECPDPPLVIFFKGQADLNRVHVIAVVGTRRITDYGKLICQRVCQDLSRLVPDTLVVSGLAYGVDIHAHRACLESGLATVGVLAHGLDRIYPVSHRGVAVEMLKNGGLLTEYVSGTNPDKGNFVRRNRIVAGLCAATIIVESASKGGALITAGLAQDYNREVFAFPGRVGDQYSEGCNALIRDNKGALISSADDLVAAMNWRPAFKKPEAIQRELFPELDGLQADICQQLRGSESIQLDQLCITLNVPVQKLSAALFDLEMAGIVKMTGGGRYRLLL